MRHRYFNASIAVAPDSAVAPDFEGAVATIPAPPVKRRPYGRPYGWGVVIDDEGRPASRAMESDEYSNHNSEGNVLQLLTVRARRA